MSIVMIRKLAVTEPGGTGAWGLERDEAIAALFDQHYTSLHGLARVILGDSALAEEVVSEAFVKTFAGWRRFSRVEHQPAYLRRMVVNECRMKIRRQSIERRVNALAHRDHQQRGPDWDPEQHAVSLDIASAVRRLPERQRICVVLRYLEDMPDAEIAMVLDCSVGTVKSQLFKARSKLGAVLAPSTEEVGDE